MAGSYLQLGYVTNDLDAAIAAIREGHGMGPFKEMRALTIGARDDREVTAHFALAFKDNTQFEIIQPTAGDRGFYEAVLPAEGFGLGLHHMGRYFPDPAEYAAAKDAARAKWAMPIDHAIFDGGYCYFDARVCFGHYLEMYHFPEETHFEGVPRY